jgi:hypothetical protein
VALHFIALSLRGLRVTALRRCLRDYLRECADMLEDDDKTSIELLCKLLATPEGAETLAGRFHPLLVLGHEEALQGLGDVQRWFDLQPLHEEHDDREVAVRTELLDIRLVELREMLLDDLLNPPASADEEARAAENRRFANISLILAEQALNEGTVQLRGLSAGASISGYTLRRLLQAAYHGLMSLSFETEWVIPDSMEDHLQADVRGSHLPRDPYKRYVYLYEFVFRRCIDNAPEWQLGRGLGRFDVRLALLTMFVNPGWARRVLASLYGRPLDERGFKNFGAFVTGSEVTAAGRFRSPLDARSPYLRGAIGHDLFRALLHSASRTGHETYVARNAELLGKALSASGLPGGSSRDENLSDSAARHLLDAALATLHSLRDLSGAEPKRRSAGLIDQFAFGKLAIDAKQALTQTVQARQSCMEWLVRLDGKKNDDLLSLGGQLNVETMDKEALERDVLVLEVNKLLGSGKSKRELHNISDLYFRLGEILAGEADEVDSKDYPASARRYANAYAVYWIGDRLRSAAATSDVASVEWPVISARAMRYYVRVSLKLAKLSARIYVEAQKAAAKAAEAAKATEGAEAQSIQVPEAGTAAAVDALDALRRNSKGFFAHARGRIDVFCRHMYRLPIERLSMHLLVTAAARVWASMERLLEGATLEREKKVLEGATEYLDLAEAQLAGLGYVDGKMRRFLFERIKTFRRLSQIDPVHKTGLEKIIARDLAVLRRLSGENALWKRLVKSLEDSLKARA